MLAIVMNLYMEFSNRYQNYNKCESRALQNFEKLKSEIIVFVLASSANESRSLIFLTKYCGNI